MASPVRRRILAAGAVVYAAAASATAPLTGAAMVMVAVPAAGVLVLAVRSQDGRGRPAPLADTPPVDRLRRTATAWAVAVLFGGVLELTAWLRQPASDVASPDHPTLSLLLDPVTGGGPGRLVAWCAWLYAGWRVARR